MSSILIMALIFAFGFSAFVYAQRCYTHDGKCRSFFLFILGLFLSAFLSALVIVNIFERVACSDNSDQWCGWGAVMLSEPIAIIIGMAIFLYFWAKKRNAQNNAGQ